MASKRRNMSYENRKQQTTEIVQYQVHMVADHEVLVPEIHEILMTTIEANKVWRAEARLKLDKASSKVPDHDGSTTGRRISPSRDDPCVGVNPDDDEEESFSLFGSVDSFINSAAATNGLAEARTCPEPEVDRVSGPETPGGAEARVPESAAPPASVITPPVVTSNAAEKQTGGGAKPEPPPPPVPPGTTPKANHVKLEKDNVLKCPTFGCSARFMQASNMEYHKNCHIVRGLVIVSASCKRSIGGPDGVVVSMIDYHAIGPGFDSLRGQSWSKARLGNKKRETSVVSRSEFVGANQFREIAPYRYRTRPIDVRLSFEQPPLTAHLKMVRGLV
ncbi:hypothetical protein AAG570_007170 [Ranatra chinensis]|uniref:C2H2-type domain-containing protein n=1 Tax=Ranatra chinensis TaxID=642074 RepID=A0ABD0YGW6_9HEMI